eukprot:PhM_4_TR15890/c1_g6_i1/m.71967
MSSKPDRAALAFIYRLERKLFPEKRKLLLAQQIVPSTESFSTLSQQYLKELGTKNPNLSNGGNTQRQKRVVKSAIPGATQWASQHSMPMNLFTMEARHDPLGVLGFLLDKVDEDARTHQGEEDGEGSEGQAEEEAALVAQHRLQQALEGAVRYSDLVSLWSEGHVPESAKDVFSRRCGFVPRRVSKHKLLSW